MQALIENEISLQRIIRVRVKTVSILTIKGAAVCRHATLAFAFTRRSVLSHFRQAVAPRVTGGTDGIIPYIP